VIFDFIGLLAIFLSLASFDLYSTYSAMAHLHKHGASYLDYELNPILRTMIKHFGIERGILLFSPVVIFILIAITYFAVFRGAWSVAVVLLSLYSFIVCVHIGNARIIKQLWQGEKIMQECDVDILIWEKRKRQQHVR
jgi:FlaA1/EpsC-like NDP-sugar epimerase